MNDDLFKRWLRNGMFILLGGLLATGSVSVVTAHHKPDHGTPPGQGPKGDTGEPGPQGPTGPAGFNALIVIVAEPPGSNCPAGGHRVLGGTDDGSGGGAAFDGVLHPDEVDASAYVCNGEPGDTLIEDFTIWQSPLGMIGVPLGSSESNLIITRGGFGNTLRVSSSQAGDLQWLSLPLSVIEGQVIKGVEICYQLSNERSFISQIRLSEENEPPTATVIHDDGTDLTSTVATCYVSPVSDYLPSGAVTLSLRLNYGDGGDRIYIGSVGLIVGS